jgi:hypothetical protein
MVRYLLAVKTVLDTDSYTFQDFHSHYIDNVEEWKFLSFFLLVFTVFMYFYSTLTSSAAP